MSRSLIRSPGRPQSPFTASPTKFVSGLLNLPEAFDKFAPQYDVSVLKALALDRIRCELGKCDIVQESFSRFANK